MGQLTRIPLDGGGVIVVETDEGPDGGDDEVGRTRVGRGQDTVRQTAETLQSTLARVQPALTAVVGQVRGLAQPPDKVSVEFGIKITAEAGAVIARAATEANFTVKAEWSRDSEQSRE
ncbi:CU044_2847 family protein [Streptomyces sp. NPDC020096]